MALANPVVISVLLTLGLAILLLFTIPGKQNIGSSVKNKGAGLRERIKKSLHSAGLFDQAPSIIAIALVAIISITALIFFKFVGWPGIILAIVAVLFSAQMYLIHRQKAFMSRAHDEMVPFLNRIATSVGSGVPAPKAYMQAVEEANVLKEVLEESAAKIATGEKFTNALLETLPLLPLRMWAVFVRQIELYEEVGGDAETTIQATVNQVNQMLQLQAEARADFAAIVFQQRIIILIVVLGLVGLFLVLPNGSEMLMVLLTTPIGIFGLVIGISVILLGLWVVSRSLRDIERKMSF
jgi:Flp pilus assembly protein TadB